MAAATTRSQIERLRALRAEGGRIALSLAEHSPDDAQTVLAVAMQLVRFFNGAPGLAIVTSKDESE